MGALSHGFWWILLPIPAVIRCMRFVHDIWIQHNFISQSNTHAEAEDTPTRTQVY
jgi:hypothetical protein